MADNMSGELARKISQLEKKLASQSAVTNNTPGDFGDIFARYMFLSELRAFWPFSSFREGNIAVDISGQGRDLSCTSTTRYVTSRGMPFVGLNGSSSILQRTDETGLDVTSNFTVGGWFNKNVDTDLQGFIAKYTNSSSTSNFALFKGLGDNQVTFNVYSGSSITGVSSATNIMPNSEWHFIVGRFNASDEVALFVDDVKYVETTGVPASLNNSTDALKIGFLTGNQYLNGYVALPFLCVTVLSDANILRLFNCTRWIFGI